MTNKEIVKEMKKMVSVCGRVTIKKDDEWVTIAQLKKEDVEQIEKDLEILELIKERLIHNILGNIVFKDKPTETVDEDGNTIFIDVDKYKIMEWLDNDKQRSTKCVKKI